MADFLQEKPCFIKVIPGVLGSSRSSKITKGFCQDGSCFHLSISCDYDKNDRAPCYFKEIKQENKGDIEKISQENIKEWSSDLFRFPPVSHKKINEYLVIGKSFGN